MVRAHEYDAGAGMPFAHQPRQLYPIDAGHHEIHDREFERAFGHRHERSLRVRCRVDFEALNPQAYRHHAGMVRFVVDDQDTGYGKAHFLPQASARSRVPLYGARSVPTRCHSKYRSKRYAVGGSE